MDQNVQIVLTTKDKRYAVPSYPVSVLQSADTEVLDNLVKDLISENTQICLKDVNFYFLLDGKYLTTTLFNYITETQISSEIFEIEYAVKQQAPFASGEIEQDGFISCVRRRGKYGVRETGRLAVNVRTRKVLALGIKTYDFDVDAHENILTGSYENSIQMWTVEADEPIFNIELEDKVKCVEWISLGQDTAMFVSGSFDQTARIWHWDLNENTLNCVATCRGHRETVTAVSKAISGIAGLLFATGSWDTTIKIWSASSEQTDLAEETGGIAHHRKSSDKPPTRIPRVTLAGHREAVSRVCWLSDSCASALAGDSPASRLVSASWDHSLRVWDVSTGAQLRVMMSNHALQDMDVAPQGLLTAASDNRVRIYDLRAQDSVATVGYRGHTGWLTCCVWAPHRDDHFVTGSIDQSVRLWDRRRTDAPLYDLIGHSDMVTSVDWALPVDALKAATSPKHYILSSAADGLVKVYNYPT